jgi:Ca2+-binding EF-hand superfamily protein
MSELKTEFETALTNKLCLKSTDSNPEEEILLNSFKLFDINNKNTCNQDEFIQTMKYLGISGFKESDLINIFKIYNTENNGELNYIELINDLYGPFEPEQTFNPKKNNHNNNINNNIINMNNNDNSIKESLIKKKSQQEIQGNLTKKEYLSENSIKEIIEKIRNKLLPNGIKGISQIIENFRKIDTDNSQGIDYEEFKKASNIFQFNLNENELEKAFIAFDRNNNGIIEYDEFLRTIRGEMNDYRKKIVFNAFRSIDINKNGAVNINYIKNKYNAKNHPDVKSGKKNENEVYNDFIYYFDIAYNYLNGSQGDGYVIFDDFLEYYQNISMFIENDDYFELLVNSEWNINNNKSNYYSYNNNNNYMYKDNLLENKYYQNSNLNSIEQTPLKNRIINNNNYNNIYNTYSNNNQNKTNYQYNIKPQNQNFNQNINFHLNNQKKISNNPFKKFRDIIASRGPRGIMSLRRSFMLSDEDNSKLIDFDDFIKYCFEYKIPLTVEEQISIFSQFDNNNEGQINYIEFLNTLIGKMNAFRFQITNQVFNYLDVNNNGYIYLNDMRNLYNVKNHPDVVNGRRSAPEVEAEFLDNIDYHFQLLRTDKLRNGKINFQEFNEYYDIISMSIHSDFLFQNILFGVWGLNGDFFENGNQNNYEDNY